MKTIVRRSVFVILFAILFNACYQVPEIPGWDHNSWSSMNQNCESNRIAQTENILIPNKDYLLGKTQNNIENLLGNPDRHQLYDRNQKFFYYDLDCEKTKELSIRFDALGRVKEIQVLLKDSNKSQ